jgi:dihydropteroate synthase
MFDGANARPPTSIMGVINVTPDSFSDGGRFLRTDDAVAQAVRLASEGADYLDIGGESSRPGAAAVGEQEELDRVAPVIERILAEVDVPVSIDTYKARVAAECLASGALYVNDITGLEDPEMIRVVAEAGAGVFIMHMRGRPQTMQRDVQYEDVVQEIRTFLEERAGRARDAGIERIVIDPGIGFGKTAAHNFELIRRLGEFASLDLPILVGPSRKSFLGSLPSGLPAEERLEGTLAAVAVSVLNGAAIVRVHDVAETRRVVEVVEAIRDA